MIFFSGKKLFGEAYSGLEYDYRGLIRVYGNQHDIRKRYHYSFVLNDWKAMREAIDKTTTSPFNDPSELSLELTLEQFMSL